MPVIAPQRLPALCVLTCLCSHLCFSFKKIIKLFIYINYLIFIIS